jgi:fructose-1,6-bisphosphatase/inositol monophosphatase family enzyme
VEGESMIVVAADALRAVLDAATQEFHRLASGEGGVMQKADGTPITPIDRGLDAFLRERLLRLVSDAAWLSEETAPAPDRLSRRWAWIVDPLDGTKEFACGVPEFAISIGLVEAGCVRAGGVVNPAAGIGAVTGTDGSSVQWPARPMRSAPRDLSEATASVSRTETEDGSIAPFLDLVGRVRKVGSVANKLLRVACGIDDVTFSVQAKSEWDLCGGVALLVSRGLKFARLDGLPVAFNQPDTRIRGGFVAGPRDLVCALETRLQARLSRGGRVDLGG